MKKRPLPTAPETNAQQGAAELKARDQVLGARGEASEEAPIAWEATAPDKVEPPSETPDAHPPLDSGSENSPPQSDVRASAPASLSLPQTDHDAGSGLSLPSPTVSSPDRGRAGSTPPTSAGVFETDAEGGEGSLRTQAATTGTSGSRQDPAGTDAHSQAAFIQAHELGVPHGAQTQPGWAHPTPQVLAQSLPSGIADPLPQASVQHDDHQPKPDRGTALRVSGEMQGITREDGGLSCAGSLNATGGTGETRWLLGSSHGSYGDLTLTPDGRWSYMLSNGSQAVQELGDGDSASDRFVVFVSDAAGHAVLAHIVIKIDGSNDGAVITGLDTANLVEDQQVSVSARLRVDDVDQGEASFIDESQAQGRFGFLSIEPDGVWTYHLDSHLPAVQGLKPQESTTDSITVCAKDGTTHTITVTIWGRNDTPALSAQTQSATEDGAKLSGHMIATDADAGDTLIFSTATPVDGFTLNADGSYAFDPGHASYQHLAAGQTQDLVIPVTVTDSAGGSSTQNLTITVTGRNDVATIAGAIGGGTAEDSKQAVTGQLSIADVDNGQAHFLAQNATAGSYGSLSLAEDGRWSYQLDNSKSSVQALKTGETATDSFTITTADGTTRTLSVTVTGRDDGAVIAGADTATVTEDQDVVTAQLQTSGQLSVTDPDAGQAHFNAQYGIAASYGRFSMDATGAWIYSADNKQPAIQQLKSGETLTDTLTVTSADGTRHTVTVTLNGTNDAPVLQAQTQAVTEDGTQLRGQMVASDVDASDTKTFSIAQPVDGFRLDADGSYSFDPTHASYQHLAAGQTQDVVIPVTVADTAGASSTQNLTITVTGVNDGAVIAGTDTAALTEDRTAGGSHYLQATGTLSVSDVDAGEALFQAGTSQGQYGELVLYSDGRWMYQADNRSPAVQALKAAEQATESFTVHSADGTAHTITLTIRGSNDAPTVAHALTATTAVEDAAFSFGIPAGAFADLDTGDTLTLSTGSLPAWLHFDAATGTFSGTPANDDVGTRHITVTATDGSGAQVSTTFDLVVSNTNDAPVLNSIASVRVTEDGAQATGHFTATDPDSGDTLTYGIGQAVDGLTVNADGSWSFDPGHASYQHLAAGQTQTLTIPVTVTDAAGARSTQDLVLIVTGTNDGAVIAGTDIGAITEDRTAGGSHYLQATGTLSVTDVDAGEALFQAGTSQGQYGDLVLHSDGRWMYQADNRSPAVQALKAAEQATESFTVHSADGTAHTITLTITGSNDGAVILGTDRSDLTEDVGVNTAGKITASGILSVSDADAGEAVFPVQMGPSTQGYGGFVLGPRGNWTYIADNASPAIQALKAGDRLTDSFTVHSADGTTHTVSVTIHGSNDAPTVAHGLTTTTTAEDAEFSLAIPAGTFADLDRGDTLTLSAGSLPAWLHFDAATGAFSGTPSNGDVGTIPITVTATDGSGARVSTTFNLVVTNTNDAPTLDPISVLRVTEDGTRATGHFIATDPDTGDTLTYSIAQPVDGLSVNADGSYTFDTSHASYQHLAGGQTLDVVIPVTVTDSAGATSTQNLTITVTGTNDGPAVVNADAAHAADLPGTTEDTPHTYSQTDLLRLVGASDLDGDTLSISQVAVDTQYGAFTQQRNGDWLFTPAANAHHDDIPLTLTVSDSHATTTAQARLDISPVTDAPRPTLAVLAEQHVIQFGDTGAPAIYTAGGIQSAGDLHDFAIEMTVVGGSQVAVHGHNGPTLVSYATSGDLNAMYIWRPENLQLFIRGQRYDTGVDISHDTGSHRYGFVWNGTAGTFDVLRDGQILKHLDGLPQGAALTGGGVMAFGNDQDSLGGGFQAEDAWHGQLFSATVATGGVTAAQMTHGALRNLAHGANLIMDLQAQGPRVVDLTGHHTIETSGPVTTPTTQVDTTIANPNPGALLHLTPNFGAPLDPDDTVTAAVLKGFVAGTELSDGHGHSHTISGPDDRVDITHWDHTGLTAQLPMGSRAGAQLVLEVSTTGPGGNIATATSAIHSVGLSADPDKTETVEVSLQLDIAPTDSPALIAGQDTGSVTEDLGISQSGRLEARGHLTIQDPDPGQAVFVPQTDTPTQYGQFSINAQGHWVYQALNKHPDVQALPAGATLNDLLQVTSPDGSQHTISITINGTNDAPVIATQWQSVTEDGRQLTGHMLATDADAGDSLSFSIANAVDGFTLNADGSYSFDPGNAAYQHLAAGQTQDLIIPITVTDSAGAKSTQNLTITLTGSNDGPLVSHGTAATAADLGAINEDMPRVFSEADLLRLVGASDVDDGAQLHIVAGSLTSAHGSFSGDAAHGYTFTPAANFSGQDVELKFSVTDGTVSRETHGQLDITPVADAPDRLAGHQLLSNFDDATGAADWQTNTGGHAPLRASVTGGQGAVLVSGSASESIHQTLDTFAGQRLNVAFDLMTGPGYPISTLDVLWEGKVVATIETSHQLHGWSHHELDLVASGPDSRLEFKAAHSPNHATAVEVDNIGLTYVDVRSHRETVTNQDLRLSLDSEFRLIDSDGSESLHYLIKGLPVGFTLTDGTHSVTVGQADQEIDTRGWQQDALRVQATHDFSGALDIQVTARSEETGNQQTADAPLLPMRLNFGSADVLTVAEDTPKTFSADKLLALAGLVPPHGQQLTLSDVQVDAALGHFSHNSDGSWTFNPAANVSADQVPITLTATGGARPLTASLSLAITPVVDTPVGGLTVQTDFDHQSVGHDGWAYVDGTGMGWHTDYAKGIQVGQDKLYGGTSSSNQIVELAANAGKNIYRDLPTTAGQALHFSFDLSARAGSTVAALEVVWEGKVIDTIKPGSAFGLVHHDYDLVATGANSRIELRATGGDGRSIIDNIAISPPPQVALVNHALHLDVGHAFQLADTDGSETISYLINGLPVGFTLSDGSHSVTATTAGQQMDLKGWQLDSLVLQSPADFEGQLVLKVSARAEEGATHESATSPELPLQLSFGRLSTAEDTPRSFSERELLQLAGVVPAAGEHLSLSAVQVDAAFGQITHNTDGSWTFTPPANVSADQVALNLTVAGGAQSQQVALPLQITAVTDDPLLGAGVSTSDFEQQRVTDRSGSQFLDPGKYGWHSDGAGGVEVGPETSFGGSRSGNQVLELISRAAGTNDPNLYRDLTTEPGQRLLFAFDLSRRAGWAVGPVQVLWEGKVIDIITPTDSGFAFHHHAYDLVATGSSARLELRVLGDTADQRAVFDNLYIGPPPQLALVNHELHLKLDDFFRLADTDGSESLSYLIKGLPLGFTLSDGSHSVTVTAADQVIDTQGWQQSTLHVQPPKDFSGTLDLSVTGRSEELGNHQTASSVALPLRLSFERLGTVEDTPLTLSESKLLALAGVVPGVGEHLSLSDVQVDAAFGHFSHNADGSWTFTPAANVNADQVPFTLTVTGGAQPISSSLQLSISPVNDAPVLGDTTVAATEGGAVLHGRLNATDVDAGDSLHYSLAHAVDGLTLNADGSYSFDPGHAAYQHMAPGQTEQLVIPVTVTDAAGASSTAHLSIDLTGTNTGAVIAGRDYGSVMEDYQVDSRGRLEFQGALTISDQDAGQAKFSPENAVGTAYGRYTIDQLGNWLYTADNSLDAIQKLKTGEHLTDSFTVHSADGTAHTINITIQGQDDAPVFVPHAGPVRSDDMFEMIGHALSNSDPYYQYLSDMILSGRDPAPFDRAIVVIKNAGVSLIGPDGHVDHQYHTTTTCKTEVPIIDMIHWHARGPGYQVVFTDNTASAVMVSAHNTNNPGGLSGHYPYTSLLLHPEERASALYPLMHEVAAASGGEAVEGALAMPPAVAPQLYDTAHVVEDDGHSITGSIEVTDADAGQSVLRPQTGTATHYGRFSIDVNGDGVHQLDNSHPEVQQLGDGQPLVDTVNVRSADGTAHEVNVTIHGQNDGALITGADSGHVQSSAGHESATPEALAPYLHFASPLAAADTMVEQDSSHTAIAGYLEAAGVDSSLLTAASEPALDALSNHALPPPIDYQDADGGVPTIDEPVHAMLPPEGADLPLPDDVQHHGI